MSAAMALLLFRFTIVSLCSIRSHGGGTVSQRAKVTVMAEASSHGQERPSVFLCE
jgi:hypothetical protein